MGSKVLLTFQDYDQEFSTVSLEGETVDGVTYTVENANTEMDALKDAILAVTLCSHYRTQKVMSQGLVTLTPPSNAFAQRETKWLLRYRDNVTNKVYTAEVPGADLDLLDTQAKGYLDTSQAEWTALKTAFENFVLSADGNAVVLLSAQHVGRNI